MPITGEMQLRQQNRSLTGRRPCPWLTTILVATVLVQGGCAAKRQNARSTTAEPTPEVVAPQAKEEASREPPARQPIIVPGTGILVGTPPERVLAQRAAGDGYELSFIDADIASVVASVIGEGLGRTYVVDPQVKGTMRLQASRPLARDELLPALEAALNLYGAALVDVSGVYNVVPNKDAARRIGGLRGPTAAPAPGFAVQIVPLKYVSATEMEQVLRPFAPDGGIMRVDAGRNLLVLSGSSRELGVMREVISTFDVDWLAGMSFALFPVEYVDVKTLADELANVFADSGSPIANVVRIVPIARLNSLMVITHDANYLRQAESWIRRLDIGVATPGRRIYVYDVQNGKADDLADSMGKILSLSVSGASHGEAARSRSTPWGSSDSPMRNAAQSGVTRPNGPLPSERGHDAGAASASTTPGALKIVPNVENNALLIYATPSEFSLIEGALKRLDAPPIQVLIEASLAEVSLTDDLRYGLQWAFQTGDDPVILSEATNGSISPKFPGFSYFFTGQSDIRAVLSAIETVTDVNVISSPKLLVLNNREAELQIGDQVPITVQSAVGTSVDTPAIVNSIQLRDTGVILRITPRVNRSGMVLLDVAQEVSDVVPTTTSNIDSPTIQQRRISSTVAVRNGETIALGGLIRDTQSRTRGGVPLAIKLPLIGGLFGSTTKSNRRTELIVLITPRVVRSAQESEALMDELKQQFRGLRDQLPEWNPPAASSAPASTVSSTAPSPTTS